MYNFSDAVKKLQWYLDNGRLMKNGMYAWRHGAADIQFYTSDFELVYEFSFGDYSKNVIEATAWLLANSNVETDDPFIKMKLARYQLSRQNKKVLAEVK